MSGFMDRKVRVMIEIDADTKLVGHFPAWSDPRLQKGARRLRMAGVGARSPKTATEQREQERFNFFNELCDKVEVIERGCEPESLSDGEGWQEKLFPIWRLNMVAYFEDRAGITDDERGNSSEPSQQNSS